MKIAKRNLFPFGNCIMPISTGRESLILPAFVFTIVFQIKSCVLAVSRSLLLNVYNRTNELAEPK